MEFLIKLVARGLGRKIESGSMLGAFAGAMLGIIAGGGLGRLLIIEDLIGADFSVAIYIIACVPLALAGALLGAAIGPRKPPADARRGVRLTRYNHAAGLLFILLILLTALVGMIVAPDEKKPPGHASDDSSGIEYKAMEGVMGILTLIATFVVIREIWYIDVGSMIRVRRLLGSQVYTRHDVRMWGFEIRPNEVVQRSFEGRTSFCIEFSDGRMAKIEVDGKDSQAIIDALGIAPLANHGS